MDPQWPDGVTLVTIRHRPVTTGGRTLAGNMVTAVASERLWTDAGSILPAEASTTIAADGSWEITLPAVDEGVRPAGAAYRLTEHVPGASGKPLWVAPMSHHAPGPVDLVDILTPRPAPGGGITIQTGPATDPSMAEIAGDPDSEFRGALTDVIAPVAAPAAEQAAATYLASEPAVTDAAALAAAQAITDQGGITDPVIAAALADPASASHQLAVPRGELIVVDTDHPTLEAALAATATGGTLEVRQAWQRAATWTIDKPVTIRFAQTGRVTAATRAIACITVTADDVRIIDATLTGAGGEVRSDGEGLRAIGTAAAPIRGLRVEGGRIIEHGKYGIFLAHCHDFMITRAAIDRIGYAGIMLLSCTGGAVDGAIITNMLMPSGYINAYGVAITHDKTASAEMAPRSSFITVTNSTVRGVPGWEGIDTHGGTDLTITNNIVQECLVGIALVPGERDAVESYAPLRCLVSGNNVDSGVQDGSRYCGVMVVGTPVEHASAVVTGNTISGHGTQGQISGINAGAILLQYTRGVVVAQNRIIRPSPVALQVYNSNAGLILADNYVEDVWTDSAPFAAVLYLRSSENDVSVAGTRLGRGIKTATLVNSVAVRSNTTLNNTVTDRGGNDWSKASARTSGSNAETIIKTGFYGLTPVERPASPGTATGTDATVINLVVTALRNLGLIT